jgi:hypothetical protein
LVRDKREIFKPLTSFSLLFIRGRARLSAVCDGVKLADISQMKRDLRIGPSPDQAQHSSEQRETVWSRVHGLSPSNDHSFCQAWGVSRGLSLSATQCLVRCDGHSIASFVLGMAAMAQDVRHVDIVLGE